MTDSLDEKNIQPVKNKAGRPKRKPGDPIRKQPPDAKRSYKPVESIKGKDGTITKVYHVPEPVNSNVGRPARAVGRPRKRDLVSNAALAEDELAAVTQREMNKLGLKSNKLNKEGKLIAERTTKNTQAKLSAAKEAESQLTAAKMTAFYKICDANNGLWRGRYFRTAGDLAEFTKAYLDTVQTIGLVPTISGFCLYLGISRRTLDSYVDDPNSPLAPVVEAFVDFVNEYNAQAGLSMSGNPAFQMFYNKCKLGWQEQPKKVDVTVAAALPPLSDEREMQRRVADIPIMDVDYNDVSGE